MTKIIDTILRTPSDDFIKLLISQFKKEHPNYVVGGNITPSLIQKFKPLIEKSIQNSLVELATQGISWSLNKNISIAPELDEPEPVEPELETSNIETTEEELAAFKKVKTIASRSKSYKLEVKYKDVASYFGLNVGGKTTWWFLRFYLTPKKKSFVTRLPINEVKALAAGFEVQEMSASLGDAASRIIISSVNDLDQLSDLILKCYETEAAKHS